MRPMSICEALTDRSVWRAFPPVLQYCTSRYDYMR